MNKLNKEYIIRAYLTVITMGLAFAQGVRGNTAFYAYGEINSVEQKLILLREHFPALNENTEILSTQDYELQNTTPWLLTENPHQAQIAGVRNYSFDVERGNNAIENYNLNLGIMHKSIQMILNAPLQNNVSVYINPKEYVRPEFNANGIQAAHLNTIRILREAGERGCVLIPAYTYVSAEQSLDNREHGVSIQNSIDLANELRPMGVRYKFILGVHNYEGNRNKFINTLNRLNAANVVDPDDRFSFFGLNARGYTLPYELLDNVQMIFGHL